MKGKIKSNMDLRKELNYLFDTNNYAVVLQHLSNKIHCNCYKSSYKEGLGKCPKCLGTGWISKFTKIKAFKQDVKLDTNKIFFSSIGEYSMSDKVFLFNYNTSIAKNDYIWETTWNHRIDKPIELINLYRVKEVSDMRGETGRIEYYSIYAIEENINNDFKNLYIDEIWKQLGKRRNV